LVVTAAGKGHHDPLW